MSYAARALLRRSKYLFSRYYRCLSIIHDNRIPGIRTPGWKGSTMFIAQLIDWYRTWWRYQREVRELAQLSDRELADIGIARSEIQAIAWQDAHR